MIPNLLLRKWELEPTIIRRRDLRKDKNQMPSSPNYQRDYKQEAATESEARKKHRSERNKARKMAAAFYGEAALDGKDVDHIRPLDQGGKNLPSNLRIRDPSANRSFSRTRTGQQKRGR